MSKASLLRSLGILVIDDFMSATECLSLCQEMHIASKFSAGTFSNNAQQEHVNDRMRKTQYCQISNSRHQTISNSIRCLKPDLEQFFNEPLSDEFEQPKYLHYGKGDFFAPHTDNQLNRKINITINLNNPKTHAGNSDFDGGELQLYGLLKQPGFSTRGVAAPSHAGCLIAYPVDVIHEVTPIVSGVRYSIVSRFLSSIKSTAPS